MDFERAAVEDDNLQLQSASGRGNWGLDNLTALMLP